MLRKLSIIALFLILSSIVIAANTISSVGLILYQTTGVDPNQIITLVLPLVVWVATWFVNWVKAKLGSSGFSGTVLVTLVVPLLSWVSAEIYSYIAGVEGNFWTLFGLGLLGTFVNEIVKQWNQTAKKVQTKAKSQLVG